MSEKEPEKRRGILGFNNIGMEIVVVDEDEGEVDTRIRPWSEVLREIKERVKRRIEAEAASPPSGNGETTSS